MGRTLALLALLSALALLAPSAASAAKGQLINCDPSPPAATQFENCSFDYRGEGTESNRAVVTLENVSQFSQGDYQVVDPGANITPTPPCQPGPNSNVMTCPAEDVADFTASLGDGNDSIQVLANLTTSIGAGPGIDTMLGGPLADNLRGGQDADTIDGGTGDDVIIGDDPDVPAGGNDSISGGAGNDKIDGQAGDDVVRGSDGNDQLSGSAGDDSFPAEAALDGTDDVRGGDGTDTATFAARTDPQQISLDDLPNDGGGATPSDNIHTDVENAVGGSGNDTITGSAVGNGLQGGPGVDNMDGGPGNDGMDGGPDNDSLAGGDGIDSLAGGEGGDGLSGGEGADFLDGGGGDDYLNGGTEGDSMAGGDGVDLADYGSRTVGVTVTLDGNAGDGEPGEGDDVKPDVENLNGGSGADSFFGSAAANALDGGAGEDYEDGGAGVDQLTGGDAGDVLRTRDGQGDLLTCGPGPDFVIADIADGANPDCDRVDRGVNQKPKLRDSAVVAPTKGALSMSPRGIIRRVPLQDKVVLPLRSIVDTSVGAVKVTSSATSRKVQSITLDSGAFDLTQTAGKLPVTQFALQGGDFATCPTAARAGTARAAATAKTRVVRHLWANGKGKFRTKGRYASATIRGTKWELQDRCDGTLIRVRSGAVTVKDLVRNRSIVVKAGKSYLARRG